MHSELKIAKEAALQAGSIILNFYKSDYEIKDKGYHNPVTTADHAADLRLKEILMEARPEYGWLSEESIDSMERLSKERVWVVDPLDGTKEFIEGVSNFVVSVALVENDVPIVGVLFNPVTDEIFTAAQGEGAQLNSKTIQCVTKDNLEDMVMLNSRSETRWGLWKPYAGIFGQLKTVGSVAYKLGLTAAGHADIFATLRPKNEWDICAGDCIVREAGGTMKTINGENIDYNQKKTLVTDPIIATNFKLFDMVSDLLY